MANTIEAISTKSGIKALLYIRDFANAKVKYQIQLNKIEADIEKMNNTALATIKGHNDSTIVMKGESFAHEIDESAKALGKTLLVIRSRIDARSRTSSSELWGRLHHNIERLKIAYHNLDNFAYTIFQDSEIAAWKKNMNSFMVLILPSIFSFTESSKLELKFIESYTSDELDKIIKTILYHLNQGFNLEESEIYEGDYLVPLRNLEEDFSKEKELWATFLAVLSI
jgi:hypothetical protein